MKVSTRGDYACRALVSLALHGGGQGPTSVRDIAERTGLPQPYLEQILLALKGAGIVQSKRGVGGRPRASALGAGAPGCASARCWAARKTRGTPTPAGERPPYRLSPATGCPMAATCTRIWCVRPVSSVRRTSERSGSLNVST